MKRVVLILTALVLLASPVFADETLTLKVDLAKERVARVRLEMELMKVQFSERQVLLQKYQAELKDLEAQDKAVSKPEAK